MKMSEPSSKPKPSAKQIYCVAHLMCDLIGVQWPTDRESASRLIERLTERRDAIAAAPLP